MKVNGLCLVLLGSVASAGLGAGMSSDAYAQDAPGASQSSQDIIVTATRREERLQDVPLAVTALSAGSLKDRGVSALSDLTTGSIAGVGFTQFAGNPTSLALSIRGVSTNDPTHVTREMPVPVYIDGIALGRSTGAGLDLVDIERMEILRGPQGQLFGRNAMGGAVQLVSRKPGDVFRVDASAAFGNYNANNQRLVVDLPIGSGLSVQLSGVHKQHDGYTKNVPRGVYSQQDDYNALDLYGLRGAVRWRPSDSFTADYSYDYTRESLTQGWLSYVDLSGTTPQSGSEPARGGGEGTPRRSGRAYFEEPYITRASGHNLTLTWEVSDSVTLKSLSAYRKVSRIGSATLTDALQIPIVRGAPLCTTAACAVTQNAFEDTRQKQYSEEAQFIGTWDRFDLTAGAIYFREEVGGAYGGRVTGPGLVAFGIPELTFLTRNFQSATTDSFGVYAQGTYTPPILDDKLRLIAGLRYSDDKKTLVRTVEVPLATGVLPKVGEAAAKRWDPAFTLQYNWTDDVNTYVRYATGYRAGGANARSLGFVPYGDEELTSWELGLKSQFWNRRATLNVALFHSVKNQAQIDVHENPAVNPTATTTINAPVKWKTQGFEVETSIRPTDRFTLGLNFAYLDADLPPFDNPQTAAVDVTRYLPVNSPEFTGSVSADYVLPVPVGEVLFHTDFAYASDFWPTPNPRPVGTNPAYTPSTTRELAARIAWRDIPIGPAHAELAVYGKNLLNYDGVPFGFSGCAGGRGFCTFSSAPRTVFVELRVRY